MKRVNNTRRQFIKTVCSLPSAACVGALASTLAGCSASQSQNNCGSMDEKNAGLRASLRYTDNAVSGPTCIDCAYFKSANINTSVDAKIDTNTRATNDCGQCAIFNGPASATGYCTSWSQKA